MEIFLVSLNKREMLFHFVILPPDTAFEVSTLIYETAVLFSWWIWTHHQWFKSPANSLPKVCEGTRVGSGFFQPLELSADKHVATIFRGVSRRSPHPGAQWRAQWVINFGTLKMLPSPHPTPCQFSAPEVFFSGPLACTWMTGADPEFYMRVPPQKWPKNVIFKVNSHNLVHYFAWGAHTNSGVLSLQKRGAHPAPEWRPSLHVDLPILSIFVHLFFPFLSLFFLFSPLSLSFFFLFFLVAL